jgi:hypothetical protein
LIGTAKIYKILTLSTFGGDLTDFGQLYWSFTTLVVSYKVIFIVLLEMNIAINGLIYLDLHLILSNPFYPRARRAKYYYLILMLIFVSSTSFAIYTYGILQKRSLQAFDPFEPLIYQVRTATTVCLSITALGILLIIIRLCRAGTSKRLRQKIMFRYLLYLTVYMSAHLPFLLTKCFELRFKEEKWAHYSNTYFFLLGVPMALIRISEPYVWNNFQISRRECCSRKKNSK